MANLSYPGVYVEEIPGGARPIEVASTSTAAFVGLAEMGPTDKAVRISSWDEYRTQFGGFISDSYLAESVFQFFNNGGRQCYIVRVTRTGTTGAKAADVTVKNRASAPVSASVKFSAKNVGVWGNSIYLTIENGTNDPDNEFRIVVRRQEDPAIVPDDYADLPALEVHDDLSMDSTAKNYVVDVLSKDSNYIDAAVLAGNVSLQRGFLKGGADPKLPNATDRKFLINIDQDGYQEISLADTVTNTPAAIATAITDAVKALTPKKTSTKTAAFTAFSCAPVTVDSKTYLLLQSGTNTGAGTESLLSSVQVLDAPEKNGATSLGLNIAKRTEAQNALAVRRPANTAVLQVGDAAITGVVTAVNAGSDGESELTDANYVNQFTLLDDKTDFSLLAVPGVGTQSIVNQGMSYCEKRPLRDVFYIAETSDQDVKPDDAELFRKGLSKPNSYGALYFPWIKSPDPAGKSSTPVLLPPSGFIAGLFARIDGTRGVWKAPAGTEATISGANGLAAELTDMQQGNLNRINVNVIRRFDNAGIVSWGARTVSSDPEYKYVPVRRTAIMLRKSIYDGIQWAVFEPNDHRLWSSLRLNIDSFMNGLFRAGAFQGEKTSDAYFVRCGLGDTMTQGDIDRGQVIVLVGFAPVKPAEFVVVRIQQKVGQQ